MLIYLHLLYQNCFVVTRHITQDTALQFSLLNEEFLRTLLNTIFYVI